MKEHLEEKKNGKNPLKLASVVEETSDDSEIGVDLLLVSSGNNVLLESWVLDSTCSYHMTPKKEWFDTYKPVWSKWVMMLHAQLLGFFFFKGETVTGIWYHEDQDV